jgi:cobalt-zinc-cadmium efflux system outer membrane protein
MLHDGLALLALGGALWLGTSAAATPGRDDDQSVDVTRLVRQPVDLVRWIEDHHNDIAAARARLAQANADVEGSRLYPNPTLDGSLGDIPVGKTNPPGLTLSETAIVDVGLSETFELGKRGPRIASAELRAQASEADLTSVIVQTAWDARSALAHVAWAQERSVVLDESLAAARQALVLEAKRLANGDLSGNDYRRLELDDTAIEADAARAHAEYDAAVADCSAVLRAECKLGKGWQTILDDAALLPVERPTTEAALKQRPDLKALELEQRSAERDAVLARRKLVPDVNLRLGYTQDQFTISGDNPRYLAVSLQLSLPTFDRGQADEARALARAQELEAESQSLRVTARAEIEALTRREQFLSSTLEHLQRDAVPMSKSVLESTEKALRQGQVALTDLLLARRTHISLLLNVLDLRFERFAVRNTLRRDLALDASLSRQTQIASR